MADIFISYRKSGVDKALSLHLAEDLREAFGDAAVFRDEKSLNLGRFEDQILDHIKSSRTMLVLIGPAWVERMADLHQPEDWVRKEIEGGLKQQVLMVPIPVDDTPLPDKLGLPIPLHGLLDFNSFPVDQLHWKDDVGRLIDALAQYLGLQKKSPGQAPIPDLSGDWIDTDGVSIRIEQNGDSIRLWLLDYYGQAVGQGDGTLSGNQVQFSLFRPDLGNGRGIGTASADGRRISGSVQYGAEHYGFSISRR